MGNLTTGAGWGWPVNSRKCHYFEQGISLCGKWMFFGNSVENQSKSKSPDDCVACRRKLEAKTNSLSAPVQTLPNSPRAKAKAKSKVKANEGNTEVNP